MTRNSQRRPSPYLKHEKLIMLEKVHHAGEPLIPQLGVRLRAWRTNRGELLKQVADRLGISKTTFSAWETGARFPSAMNLVAIAHLMDRPLCTLFCAKEQECRVANPEGTPGRKRRGE